MVGVAPASNREHPTTEPRPGNHHTTRKSGPNPQEDPGPTRNYHKSLSLPAQPFTEPAIMPPTKYLPKAI